MSRPLWWPGVEGVRVGAGHQLVQGGGRKILAQGGPSRDGLRKIGKQPKCPTADAWIKKIGSIGNGVLFSS